MPAGRPTKYNAKILKSTREYIKSCEDEEIETVKQSGEGKNGSYSMVGTKLKVHLPTMQGLALFLGVNKTTLFEWAKHYTDFSNSLDELNALQAQRLLDNGLSGDYNSTIAKLILSANHGMREKSDVTTDGQAITVNITNYDGKDS